MSKLLVILFVIKLYARINIFRPVNILPLLSQLYEELICNQQYEFAENILNSILCCFWEAHSTQHALFKLLQS